MAKGIKTVLAFAAVDPDGRIEPEYAGTYAKDVRRRVADDLFGGTEAGTWADARKMGWRVVKCTIEALAQ